MEAVAVMAKKTGPKPNPAGRKQSLIAVKCQEDFKAWVERYAEFQRVSVPTAIELALVADAKAKGFDAPPKR